MPANLYRYLLVSLVTLVFAGSAVAEEDDEVLMDLLRQNFKKEYLSVGALLQVVGDVQPERTLPGNNGFSIANFRISIGGRLDKGFGYFLQTNFVESPAILDARFDFYFHREDRISAGKFKAPFSREFLTDARNIDFVNRAQIVRYFAPGRQIGAEVGGWLDERRLHYAAGIFNGNQSSANENDNNDFLYVGRVAFYPALPPDRPSTDSIGVGFNIAASKDNGLPIPGNVRPFFTGERVLIGGDLRITRGNLLLASEFIFADLDPSDGGENLTVFGHYITGGYMVRHDMQLLFRWDRFESEELYTNGQNTNLLIFGFNFWPSSASELQANYIINTDDTPIEHNQFLVNAQIAF